MSWGVPARRRGVELLDAPDADPALAARSLRDVARANTLFGGTAAVRAALRPLWPQLAPRARLLDVGAGRGDILEALQRDGARSGITVEALALEHTAPLARAIAQRTTSRALCGDGHALPFADRSVDLIVLSQLLHHFADDEARGLVRECLRVARVGVVIGDLRRSWFAAAGLWLASFPLGFHPVSRHDGVVSVLRGYRRAELRALLRPLGDGPLDVRDRPGFRVTATLLHPPS
ncbi:MAG: methyltransferase domain-containing protein [Gemmatimonadaceae bacterium]|nr:methyltransferase domain-containing protein [Gemmatimonadaceae bacterium]